MPLSIRQGVQVHTDKLGKLRPADLRFLADRTRVEFREFGHRRTAHGLTGHVVLHLARAFGQLIEAPLFRLWSLISAKSQLNESIAPFHTRIVSSLILSSGNSLAESPDANP